MRRSSGRLRPRSFSSMSADDRRCVAPTNHLRGPVRRTMPSAGPSAVPARPRPVERPARRERVKPGNLDERPLAWTGPDRAGPGRNPTKPLPV